MANDSMMRQAFWLLQKYSSYTWNAEIARRYTALVDGFDKTLKSPPAGLVVSDREQCLMMSMWRCQSLYEDGLAALLRAEKHRAYSMLDTAFHDFSAQFYFDPIGNREPVFIDPDGLQYYLGLRNLGTTCEGIFRYLSVGKGIRFAGGWCSTAELVRSAQSDPNDEIDIYSYLPASPPDLPKMGDAAAVVKTGEEVPITGIWTPEPMDSFVSKLLKSFGRASESYCMNFLVQGMRAPEMISEELFSLWEATGDGPKYYRKKPVRWKLLWEDDRYGERGVPEEEEDYLRQVLPATE